MYSFEAVVRELPGWSPTVDREVLRLVKVLFNDVESKIAPETINSWFGRKTHANRLGCSTAPVVVLYVIFHEPLAGLGEVPCY